MSIRQQFQSEVNQPDAAINLARGALLVSKVINPSVDVEAALARIDAMAETVRQLAGVAVSPSEIFDTLNRYFFRIEKFSGNRANYYHPQNSFLDVVLLIKMGLPITLSVLYLELGWRLGLAVDGIGLPGHFLVAFNDAGTRTYLDPFHNGQILTEGDCMDIAQVPEDDREPFRHEYLVPMSKKAILYRMLMNLKQGYLSESDWLSAHRVVDFALILRPTETQLLRDRGLLAYQLNQLQDAVFDIQQYLLKNPSAADADWLENHLQGMQAKLLRLN